MSPFFLATTLSAQTRAVNILDIGARSEGQDRYAPLVEQGLAHVSGFEPDPDEFERLKARRSSFTYYPNFLGDGNIATFHVTRYPGCSSLLEPDPSVIDIFETIGVHAPAPSDNFRVIEKRLVKTTRLDDIPGLILPNYIKLDVQGAELIVLKNGERTLSSATVVETETEFLPIYKNQPLFGDLQCFFRDHGFVLHKLIDVAGRTFRPIRSVENEFRAMSQMLWADAIFVKDFTDLSRWSNDDLLKTALILNDVYKSYDLVFRLLAEVDARTKSNFSKTYFNALNETEISILYLNEKNHI